MAIFFKNNAMKSLPSPIFVVRRRISGVTLKLVITNVFLLLLLVVPTRSSTAGQKEHHHRHRTIEINASSMRLLSEFLTENSVLSSKSLLSSSSSLRKEDSIRPSLEMTMSSREVYTPIFQLRFPSAIVYSKHGPEEDGNDKEEPFEGERMLMSSTHNLKLQHVEATSASGHTCDVQFMECLRHPNCVSCFQDFDEKDIDWSIIAPNTPCDNVLNAIVSKTGTCSNLMNDNVERNVFCQTFDSCVIWKQDNSNTPDRGADDLQNSIKEDNGHNDNDDHIDCDTLSSCDWKGMKRGYIGDGICHDFIDGCYNSKVCNYDGGDCCPDTCDNSTDADGKNKCGSDGYFCRDPQSQFCQTCNSINSTAGDESDSGSDNRSNLKPSKCETGETPYKLFQYDSFGDGWDKTEMTIVNSRDDNTHTPLYDGRLNDGFIGMEYVCLSTQPACYQVKLFGGYWGNEVSWEIKPMKNGATSIASGGAPMDCEFPVSGAHCENTCTGRANLDPQEDEKYHTWHKMANCIQDKCIIQLGLCENDLVCSTCVGENSTPEYCLANDVFNALGFCAECNCVEDVNKDQKREFCHQKSREKHDNEYDNWNDSDQNSDKSNSLSKKVVACSSEDFRTGVKSVNEYAECSGVDTMSALLTNFDPDNFGMLNAFETCSSEYAARKFGISALDCMKILENATTNPGNIVDQNQPNLPIHAISSLAKDLLYDGENFCDCSFKASYTTPVCQDFIHFKTLLYQSLDGCRSLDLIDCDAWAEFYVPCKSNLVNKFQRIDFKKKQQCDYVKDRCGNVGPLASFRHFNCAQEISHEAWNFYLDFEENCLKKTETPAKPSASAPNVLPKPQVSMAKQGPTTDDDVSPADAPGGGFIPYDPKSSENKKKYVPPEKRRKGSSSSGHKVRNIVIVFILAGGAYWYFRTHYGDLDYHVFRQSTTRGNYYYGGGSEDGSAMYDSLTMQNAQATFVPPTLPPPPSAYENPVNSFPLSNMNKGFQG
mmetsp:Transcript_5368/g.10235  ORF Transcript_5368/g.10235 Transcript_5368/m.10235 type:complete len:993 (-) Transcript_5368:124-3102(-)